jgi:pre-mRNA-splicing factor SYF1
MVLNLPSIASSFPLLPPSPSIISSLPSNLAQSFLETLQSPTPTAFASFTNQILIHNHTIATSSRIDVSTLSEEEKAIFEVFGKLATQGGRDGLVLGALVYEKALEKFPSSYTLWYDYIEFLKGYILGEPVDKSLEFKLERPKKKRKEVANWDEDDMGMKEYLLSTTERKFFVLEKDENPDEPPTKLDQSSIDIPESPSYHSYLSPVYGLSEWQYLIAVIERSLVALPHLPRLHLQLFSTFLHPQCPSLFKGTYARKTFDRALRWLPGWLHERVWKVMLRWEARQGGRLAWRRWVEVSTFERYVC